MISLIRHNQSKREHINFYAVHALKVLALQQGMYSAQPI
jgi:hypothetical protein